MAEKKEKHVPSDGVREEEKKNKQAEQQGADKKRKDAGEEEAANAPQDDGLAKALEAAEDYKRKWYSVSAEYDNYRKRNAAAVSQAYREGRAEAVLKLLPVSDNFGYALSSASDEKTKAGIDKIIKNFNTILQSLGVEEVPVSVGDDFDESVMEAVMNSPAEEGGQPNKVSAVLKKGYRQDGKVIRFAQVSVTV